MAGYGGGRLTARMSGLQKTLADLCNECVVSAQAFERSTGAVLGYLIDTFKWLLKGQESIAVAKLVRCQGAAKEMADQSEALARRFKAIADETEAVLEDTQVAQGAQHEKRLQMEQQLRELAAQQKKTETLQKEVAAAAEEMQTLHREAKEREAQESTRAFVLGLASTLTSAVGSGVAAFAAARNPLASLVGSAAAAPATPQGGADAKGKPAQPGPTPATPATPAADTEAARAEAAKLKVQAEDAQKTAADAQAAATAADQAAKAREAEAGKAQEAAAQAKKEAQAAGGTAGTDAARKAADAEAEARRLQAEAEAARKKAEEARAAAEKARQAAEAVSASLREVSGRFEKMQQSAQAAADATRSEKMQYLTQMLALQKQNREALASIAEYAERMKSTEVEKGIAQAAVESLHLAVRALKQIVTSLLNASLFWRSMEQYCRALSKSKMLEDIQDVKELPLEERLAYYRDVDFMSTAIYYVARWKALEVVCGDYRVAANRAREKVLANIDAAPSIEESRRLAPALAEQMLAQTRRDMATLDSRTEVFVQQRAALAPAG